MKTLSLGISNKDLNKIPIGLLSYQAIDNDNDGLPNALEEVLGTDYQKADTDNDGYNDRLEIEKNYDPKSKEKISLDLNLANNHLGEILLQVEASGGCWYLNPNDKKRYFLGKPDDAWLIMKNLATGITDKNIAQISRGDLNQNNDADSPGAPVYSAQNIMESAAASIRANNKELAKSYFVDSISGLIEYSMDHLNAESRLLLANLLSGSSLATATDDEKKYTNKTYFSLKSIKVPLTFYVRKQTDGSWKIANL
jgi:hypothetical protein